VITPGLNRSRALRAAESNAGSSESLALIQLHAVSRVMGADNSAGQLVYDTVPGALVICAGVLGIQTGWETPA
jgi:hypothetical protein